MFCIDETIDWIGLGTWRQRGADDGFQGPPKLALGLIGLGGAVAGQNRRANTNHPEQRLAWNSSEHGIVLPSMAPTVHDESLCWPGNLQSTINKSPIALYSLCGL